MTAQVDKKVFKVMVNDVLQWEGVSIIGLFTWILFLFWDKFKHKHYLL